MLWRLYAPFKAFSDSNVQLIAFNLGSLGFLTNHFYENYIRDLKGVIYGREDLEQCCLDLEDGLAVSLPCQLGFDTYIMYQELA